MLMYKKNFAVKFMSFALYIFCSAHSNTLHVPLIIEHLAVASEECFFCRLVLPFRERQF